MKAQERQAKFQCQLKEIITISNKKNFYFFQTTLNQWEMLQTIRYQQDKKIDIKQFPYNQVKQIKAITLNVLFDFRNNSTIDQDRGHMKFSIDRYQFIFKQLQKIQADVISLNQVTKEFVKLLQKQEWVRKQYFLSVIHNSKDFNYSFGNILISKLKPFSLIIYKVPSLPRPIMIGFFIFKGNNQNFKIASFSSIHLIAYEQKWDIRKQQLKNITKYLQKFKGAINQHILIGDMNFHNQKQNQTFQQNGLKDCWLELYKLEKDPGFTFDSEKNSFIKQMYWGFQKRRMRLDRMFFTARQKPFLTPSQMRVCFNEPIYKHQIEEGYMFVGKSVLSFLADKFNKNLFRKKQDYLFASDHFGLQTIFAVNLD